MSTQTTVSPSPASPVSVDASPEAAPAPVKVYRKDTDTVATLRAASASLFSACQSGKAEDETGLTAGGLVLFAQSLNIDEKGRIRTDGLNGPIAVGFAMAFALASVEHAKDAANVVNSSLRKSGRLTEAKSMPFQASEVNDLRTGGKVVRFKPRFAPGGAVNLA